MTLPRPIRGLLASAVVCVALPALAQDNTVMTTSDEVRTEISEAMDAIAAYSEQESDQALTEAREALNRLDAEIARREQALRENWAEMTEAARETAQARVQDLREARNRLGERFGALEAGTSSAWNELKEGFSDAWSTFSDAWTAADEGASSN